MTCSDLKRENCARSAPGASSEQPSDLGVDDGAELREWFAIAVKPRHEKSVAQVLDSKGYETFVPLYKHRSRRATRLRNFELPLFPGYVFSRFELMKRLPVVTTPGVNRVLGVGPNPSPVDPMEIASLRRTLDKALSAKTIPFFQTGTKVRICEGPLQGVLGIIVSVRGELRIVLSATLLQRSVLVEVDSTWLIAEASKQNLAKVAPSTVAYREPQASPGVMSLDPLELPELPGR